MHDLRSVKDPINPPDDFDENYRQSKQQILSEQLARKPRQQTSSVVLIKPAIVLTRPRCIDEFYTVILSVVWKVGLAIDTLIIQRKGYMQRDIFFETAWNFSV